MNHIDVRTLPTEANLESNQLPVLEPERGIEPRPSAWRAEVLPLDYTGKVGWELMPCSVTSKIDSKPAS